MKFAALLVAPLWLTYPGDPTVDTDPLRRRVRTATAIACRCCSSSLHPWSAFWTFLDRTIGFQIERNSPFSIWDWGQYHAQGIPDLAIGQLILQIAVMAFAGVVAVVPRRKGPLELAALTAAVLLGFQLVLTHWFYLYLPGCCRSSSLRCSSRRPDPSIPSRCRMRSRDLA